MDEMYRDLMDEGFAVIAIDVSNDTDRTRQFYLEYGWVMPAAFDTKQVAGGIYGITGTPTNYLVDTRGRIVGRNYGYRRGDELRLRAQVEALLRSAP